MYCLSAFLQQCGCSFTRFSLCEVYLLSSHFLKTLFLVAQSRGPRCLTSAPSLSQHVSSPPCCSPSVASNFSSSPTAALQHPLSFVCSPPYAPLHSRALMHSASAPPHPPSTFPSLQSHLYSPLPILFTPPTSASLPSCFSPCVLRRLGHSQHLKKASACDGLSGIAYLVHYSQYTHFSKHNYIQIIPAVSQWMSALLADVKGWVKASNVCQALCVQCTNSTALLAEGVKVHRRWFEVCLSDRLVLTLLPHQPHTNTRIRAFVISQKKSNYFWFVLYPKMHPHRIVSTSCFPRVHRCEGMCSSCAGVQTVE